MLGGQVSCTLLLMCVSRRRIQNEIEDDVKRAELLAKDGRFNERYCLRCFDKFTFLLNPKVHFTSSLYSPTGSK